MYIFGYLVEIESCDVNEDILCVAGDLGVVSVDDWGHGEDDPVLVKDNGINRFVPYDWQVVTQMTVFLEEKSST